MSMDFAALGIAVALAAAALGALWKIVNLMVDFAREQDRARHQLRSDLTSLLTAMETRLGDRIRAVENVSYGWREQHPGRSD